MKPGPIAEVAIKNAAPSKADLALEAASAFELFVKVSYFSACLQIYSKDLSQ